MDTLIGLLVVVVAVAVFVRMVRRTKAKACEFEHQMDGKPWLSNRPALLTREQRKALNESKQNTSSGQSTAEAVPLDPRPAKKATRAIRTGWSMGLVEFYYEDADGNITHRTVTVHSITSTYLKGACHARQEERTFRIDRIMGDLTDCETGEFTSPQKWAKGKAL